MIYLLTMVMFHSDVRLLEGFCPLTILPTSRRLPRTVTAYPGFEDFCDAVQAEAVKTSGEAWQAVSDECKAWLVHGPGNSCGGVYLVCLCLPKFHRGCFMLFQY